jgi:hypothetical protein
MIFISIRPFALPKILLAIVAFLCFSALCLADPVLMVRRYAPAAERLAVPRVLVFSGQESVGVGRVGIANTYFANFGLTDLLARQTGRASSDGGDSTGSHPAMPSSVFRSASCAMRSSGASATIHDGRNLPELATSAEL